MDEFEQDETEYATADESAEPVFDPEQYYDRPDPIGFGRLALLLGVIWGAELFIAIVIAGAYMMSRGEVTGMFPLPVMLLMTAVSWCVTLTLCVLVGIRPFHDRIASGLGIHAVEWRVLRQTALMGVGYAIIALVVLNLFAGESQTLIEQMVEGDGEGGAGQHSNLFYFMIFALFVPPLEEMYYRGFLFQSFQQFIGTYGAAILMIIWFTVIHAMQLSGSLIALLVILGLSGLCMWVRIRHNSVLPAIAFHLSYNFVLVAATLVSLLFEET